MNEPIKHDFLKRCGDVQSLIHQGKTDLGKAESSLIKIFILAILLTATFQGCAKKWDVLSLQEKAIHQQIMNQCQAWMPQKKEEGSAPLITFEELYDGLSNEEKHFLDRVRAIKPPKEFKFQGLDSTGIKFKKIEGQEVMKDGKKKVLGPQYLPENVYEAYDKMMAAMKKDLGKRLHVDSGYRSPAYQLYTFLFYLPKHHYSLAETGQWVALPGHSEHGSPQRQAIDFVNEEGVDGDEDPEDFARLPEYEWLVQNAGKFGFELSYPRGGNAVTFEPWHWRYIGT